MKSFIQRFDNIGVPVNLNYMGEGNHKTFVGGISSILACAFIIPFAILLMLPLLFNQPDFDVQEIVDFISPSNNTIYFSINSEQLLIASKMSMSTPDENFNFTKYIVPMYVSSRKDIVNNAVKFTSQYSKAVDCLDAYGSSSTSLSA
jgi:hypothetical protein